MGKDKGVLQSVNIDRKRVTLHIRPAGRLTASQIHTYTERRERERHCIYCRADLVVVDGTGRRDDSFVQSHTHHEKGSSTKVSAMHWVAASVSAGVSGTNVRAVFVAAFAALEESIATIDTEPSFTAGCVYDDRVVFD